MNFDITIAQEYIGDDLIQTVNGRQVHAALEVGKDYSSWVKAQIKRARLADGRDFTTVTQEGVGGKFSSIDYHFTIEGCKHIAMISGTDKGFEVRDYFIDCEKKMLAPKPPAELSRLDLIHLALDSENGRLDAVKKVYALGVVVAEQAPKVEALNRIATSMQGSLCIRDAAKNLQVAEKQLKNFLFDNGWVYNREGIKGTTNPLAYSSKLSSGLLEHKMSSTAMYASTQVRVTAKGLTKLAVAFESA